MNSNKRILFLDDSKIVCNFIKKSLNDIGYQNVYTVSTIEDARELIDKSYFDIALLDYNIAGENSEVLLDYIKIKFPDIIVIMLSGQDSRSVMVKLMRKADDYVIKEEVSKTMDELVYSMNHAIEVQELKKQNTKLVNEIKSRNEILKNQLETAKFLLKDVFPDKVEKSDQFKICAYNWQWEVIGGDFYHVDRLDGNKIGIFIADICGHGIQAALLLFTLSNAYKEAIKENLNAKDTMKKLNSILLKQFPEYLYVTCCYVILNEEQKKIVFSSAFQTPILYLKQDKTIEELNNGRLHTIGIIDMDKKIFGNSEVFEESEIVLKKNEKLFLFTDGVNETRNFKGEMFGIDSMKNEILANADKSLDDMIREIYGSLIKFSENVTKDDITIIGVEKI